MNYFTRSLWWGIISDVIYSFSLSSNVFGNTVIFLLYQIHQSEYWYITSVNSASLQYLITVTNESILEFYFLGMSADRIMSCFFDTKNKC